MPGIERTEERGRIYEGFGSRGLGGLGKGLRIGWFWDGERMSGWVRGGNGKGRGRGEGEIRCCPRHVTNMGAGLCLSVFCPEAINTSWLRWGRTRLGLCFPLTGVIVDKPAWRCGFPVASPHRGGRAARG